MVRIHLTVLTAQHILTMLLGHDRVEFEVLVFPGGVQIEMRRSCWEDDVSQQVKSCIQGAGRVVYSDGV